MLNHLRTRAARRSLAGVAAGVLLLSACGDEDPVDEAVDDETVGEVDATDDELAAGDDLHNPQLGGLDVTVTGNVTEVIDDQAFRIDKDGLGESTTEPDDETDDVAVDSEDDYFDDEYDVYDYYDYDYDYYDYGYYTDFDDEFDDFEETGVMVVTPDGSDVSVDGAVQANGTLRYFDEGTLETLYEVDFDDELYGTYNDQYVIVADSVKSVASTRDDAASGSTGSTTSTAQDGASSTTASG